MHDARRPSDSADRYPGYDVLAKWSGPSWNEKTREVISRRLAIGSEPKFFNAEEFATVTAIAARIVPQPTGRAPVPIAGLVDHKLNQEIIDGYRVPGMPRDGEAWRAGLKALDAEAQAAYQMRFSALAEPLQDVLLRRMQAGELKAPQWGELSPDVFFKKRMARDIVLAYYSHPTGWSEIGWGGPASPRGYVRLDSNERDPWEAAEAKQGDAESARRSNRHVR